MTMEVSLPHFTDEKTSRDPPASFSFHPWKMWLALKINSKILNRDQEICEILPHSTTPASVQTLPASFLQDPCGDKPYGILVPDAIMELAIKSWPYGSTLKESKGNQVLFFLVTEPGGVSHLLTSQCSFQSIITAETKPPVLEPCHLHLILYLL